MAKDVVTETFPGPKTMSLEDYLTSMLGDKTNDPTERAKMGQVVVSVLEAGRDTPGFVYFKPVEPTQEEPGKTRLPRKYMIYEKEDRLAPEDVAKMEDHDVPLGILEVAPEDITKYSQAPNSV